ALGRATNMLERSPAKRSAAEETPGTKTKKSPGAAGQTTMRLHASLRYGLNQTVDRDSTS
ncbi:hypothetical protein, partial [Kluyvera intermedia]|uniref:hypothetical protein n=1 Tax=Kluyvera intermedia TaxID=61648 RepID=UPI003BA02E1B